MTKIILLPLTVWCILSASLSVTHAQVQPLRPELVGTDCENTPLSPNSRDARELRTSDDPDDQACEVLRTELFEQAETEATPPQESRLNPGVIELQRTLIELLQQLQQLLSLRLQ